MNKTLIILSLLFMSLSVEAYDPYKKLECRQSISVNEFLYVAIDSLALRGHPFQFKKYENGRMNAEGSSIVQVVLNESKLRFKSNSVDLILELSPDDNESEYFIGELDYAGVKYYLSCEYFAPIDE